MMSLRVPSSAQVAYTRTTHARRARGGRRGRLDNTRVFQVAMSGYPSQWPVRTKVCAARLLARWLARRHVLALQRSGRSASSRRWRGHDHTPQTTRFKLQHPQLHQKLSAHPPSFGCTLRVGVEVWRLGLTEVERLDRSGLEEMRSGIE